VVWNRPFSASTASFFAALSTASSLRLAALCLTRGTAGLHPSSRLNLTSKTPVFEVAPGRTTSKSLPSRALAAAGCRGSNHIRPGRLTSTAQSEIRSSPVYAGHSIKPLNKLEFIRRRLQSWTGFEAPETPGTPARNLNQRPAPLPFERSRWTSGKEWSPIVSGFRNASLGVPATASTPGARSLTTLAGVAKSKIQTSLGRGSVPKVRGHRRWAGGIRAPELPRSISLCNPDKLRHVPDAAAPSQLTG